MFAAVASCCGGMHCHGIRFLSIFSVSKGTDLSLLAWGNQQGLKWKINVWFRSKTDPDMEQNISIFFRSRGVRQWPSTRSRPAEMSCRSWPPAWSGIHVQTHRCTYFHLKSTLIFALQTHKSGSSLSHGYQQIPINQYLRVWDHESPQCCTAAVNRHNVITTMNVTIQKRILFPCLTAAFVSADVCMTNMLQPNDFSEQSLHVALFFTGIFIPLVLMISLKVSRFMMHACWQSACHNPFIGQNLQTR